MVGVIAWIVKMILKIAKILVKLGLLNEDTISSLMGMLEA